MPSLVDFSISVSSNVRYRAVISPGNTAEEYGDREGTIVGFPTEKGRPQRG